MKRPVFVLNSSHPELDHLAAELDRRGLLDTYVRRYFKQDRAWEKMIRVIPGISPYASETSRRSLVAGLDPAHVVDAGVLSDFLAALVPRLPKKRLTIPLSRDLRRRRDRAIVRAGLRIGAHAQLAVANYSVASELFKAVKAHGGRSILNYPIAHHGYAKMMLEEEAQLEPGFAESLISQIPNSTMVSRLEEEVHLADRILVGSSFARDSFVSQGVSPDIVKVVPYGADVRRQFAPSQTDREDKVFRILYAGQLTQRKGIAYLLRAFAKIRGPQTELVLAGRFAGDPAAYHPYRDLFRHAGDLDQAGLAREFRRADVFVLPTLIEGMPLVVLEAMSWGVPVIVTPNGPGDIVRDGIDGFVVPIRDVDAIAQSIEMLRANPDLRRQMGLSARRRALEFSWDRFEADAANRVAEMLPGAQPSHLENSAKIAH